MGLKYLYIFTMCLAMYSKLPGINLPWFYSYIHCVIWIALFVLSVIQQGKNKCDVQLIRVAITVRKIFITPYFIFVLCSIIGWIYYIQTTQLNMITRTISNCMQFTLILFSVLSAAYFFKDKLMQYTFIAMLINYVTIMMMALLKYGISDFIHTGLLPFSAAAQKYYPNGTSLNVLEVHDLTFAAGFFLIYYLLWGGSEKNKKKRNVILSIFLVYLGFKRIELAALALITVFALFVKRKSKRSVSFWCVIYTIALMSILYLYLWLIDSELLEYMADKFQVNFMGRLSTYSYMAQYFEFSPFYIGRGMAAAIRYNVRAISEGVRILQGHSDLMFNYIDFGFWGFTAWVLYCGYFATKKIQQRHGAECAKLWMLFTAYAFITYLTDNTTLYFAFQSSYIIIMFHAFYTKGCKSDKQMRQNEVRLVEKQI